MKLMKQRRFTEYLLFCLLIWLASTNVFAATNATGYKITYNTSSSLTGMKGVTCIECTSANAANLQAAWEEAGKPSKLKIKGPMYELGLSYGGMRTTITYLDLSEAEIVAGGYSESNTLDKGQLSDLYGQESSDECGINVLVLPNSLTKFTFFALGQYEGPAVFPFTDIYTNNVTPFNVRCSMDENALFHVPEGSKAIWQQSIESNTNMIVCDTPAKTVTSTQGNLAGQLTAKEIQTVDVLTINGEMNAKDFAFLSQMSDLTKLVINATINSYYGSDGPTPSTMIYAENLIPAYTFTGKTMLRQVVLPSTYSISIGDCAFDGCSHLERFGYTSNYRFRGSEAGVSGSVGDFAFRNTKVTSVMLRAEATGIGKNPFFGTPASNTERYAHYDYDYDEGYDHYDLNNFSLVESGNYGWYSHQLILSKDNRTLYASHWGDTYTALMIPASVVEVKDYALSDICVTTVTLNSNLQKLGDAFLYKCKRLSSISATGNYASEDGVLFTADMKTLVKYPCAKTAEEYTIPATVESISKWAFEGAGNLKKLTVQSATPPTLGELVFEDVDLTKVTLYVPKGSKATYKAANVWNNFKEILETGGQTEQTLALTALPAMTYGDAAYTLPSTTAEELALTWTSSNTAVATINGNQLTIKKAGSATITATQEGDDDYLPFTREFTLTIAKAQLKITANNQTKQEGEDNPALTVSYDGFKYCDKASSLTKQPTVSTTATKNSPAGTYPITPSGAQSDNYTISYVNGALTITEKPQGVTDISLLDNAIYIEPTEAFSGSQAVLSVKMKNNVDIQTIQFDLYLPDGVTVVANEDGELMTASKERVKKFNYFESTEQSNGSFRLLAQATTTNVPAGNGEICLVVVNVPENMDEGDYSICIKDILMIERDNTNHSPSPNIVQSKLTVLSYIPGDANNDRSVNAIDFNMIGNYILGRSQTNFNVRAADINGDNSVNAIDFNMVGNMILHGSSAASREVREENTKDPS